MRSSEERSLFFLDQGDANQCCDFGPMNLIAFEAK
jgi:hypothetical protein